MVFACMPNGLGLRIAALFAGADLLAVLGCGCRFDNLPLAEFVLAACLVNLAARGADQMKMAVVAAFVEAGVTIVSVTLRTSSVTSTAFVL